MVNQVISLDTKTLFPSSSTIDLSTLSIQDLDKHVVSLIVELKSLKSTEEPSKKKSKQPGHHENVGNSNESSTAS